MAGALFGDLGLVLFVAGAVLGESLAILACDFSWQVQYLARCDKFLVC